MGEVTGIAWCHHTMNPWIGCAKVSEACRFCYAERDRATAGAEARTGLKLWGADGGRAVTSDAYWKQPLKWNREAEASGERRRVFCASLADVFEDRRDLDGHRARLWKLVEATPALDWLLLTKRPAAIRRLVPREWLEAWPVNAWAGTTVEDQEALEERVPELLAVPARVRFVSAEPLLSALDFSEGHGGLPTALGPAGISWVIVGGESGVSAREFDVSAARSVVQQCRAAGAAVFVKQLGCRPRGSRTSWANYDPDRSWRWQDGRAEDGSIVTRVQRDRKGGDPAEWPEDLRVREFPKGGAA